MTLGLINANPVVHETRRERVARSSADDSQSHAAEDAALDVFDFVRDIRDPEHPYSLEQLSVLSEESITVDEKLGRIQITFTPTVQHCSMATVIGLCLRVKLMRCFPPHYKDRRTGRQIGLGRDHGNGVYVLVQGSIPPALASSASVEASPLTWHMRLGHPAHHRLRQVDINVSPGSHANEESVNKQLNDKERVAAALENPNLRQLVDECLYSNEL